MFNNKNKRIALISVTGDPAVEIGKEEAGGQNVYVLQVGLALAELGWQVDMFSRRTSPDQKAIVTHRENCRTIRLNAGPQQFISRDEIFECLPEFVDAFQGFQQQEGIEYQLVHTHYWLSSWVGMELKKRHNNLVQVHTYHSLGAVKYKAVETLPAIASTRLETEKACLENADRIVATSPQEEAHMRTLVSHKGEIEVIPCGTDIHRFGRIDRATAREQLGIDRDAKVVLYVGRFDRRKGIETLVRAIGRSQHRDGNLKLIIGGGYRPGQSDGIERDRIDGIVKELGLEAIAEFPGRLGKDDLHLYYSAADVCVVPSHYEPFGLVAIEAMASATPVVASNVGGLKFTVVSEVNGLLVPPKNDAKFAEAIDRILADPQWRDELGKTGRLRVELAFSWDSVATRLAHTYSQLIADTESIHVPESAIAA
ncbi:glycosyltransferase family 1 protein [Oxynema sp. CENA135]|uniref:glycosyltransferase family 4 protein n=1 Tax=Oxynema sp. CENA135 TaxID=984206 RepID=UPI00190D8C72|nr:glycosyltransferase family 1 protein [Oxynema sp. CENA135]MBK4731338.1 glycosyltransferase family 1 protein [Oxynema sp. CENA135]